MSGRGILRVAVVAGIVLALCLSVATVGYADEKGPRGSGAELSAADLSVVTIPGNPLEIMATSNGMSQVYYDDQGDGQFYDPDVDYPGSWTNGPYLALNDLAWNDVWSQGYPYEEISQSSLSGAGSADNPWMVTTVVRAGNVPDDGELGSLAVGATVDIEKKVSYVNGQRFYRIDYKLTNTSGVETGPMKFYHAADLYLQGSDSGYGYYDPATGGIGGQNEDRDWFIVFQPITPATAYQESIYEDIWYAIGDWDDDESAYKAGPGFDNLWGNPDDVDDVRDNGAGLQWSLNSLAPGTSTTVSLYVAFGTSVEDITVPVTPPTPPEVPEPGSMMLLASGLAGLGGFSVLRSRFKGIKK